MDRMAARNQNKTTKTKASVSKFLASIDNDTRRKDCKTVVALMKKVTGERPTMWGASIVGFGKYHYKYASGREGDWCVTAVSPRKATLTVYIMNGFDDYGALLAKLGKHKTAKSCLYIKSLEDVDMKTLEKLITRSVKDMRKRYPS
jgi:galactokinase